jgi:hypothetical protein
VARKYILIDYIHELPEDIGPHTLPTNRLFDYVPVCREDTPLGGLLWAEVWGCFRKARLTDLEAAVMEVYLLGCKDRQIADGLNGLYGVEEYTRHNVSSIRQGAARKIVKLRDIGLGTVLVETFGLRACRRELSETSLRTYNLD